MIQPTVSADECSPKDKDSIPAGPPYPVTIVIGVDLAGLLGGTHGERRRWIRAEWGRAWGGVSLSSQLRGLGSVMRSPSGVRGRAPAEN